MIIELDNLYEDLGVSLYGFFIMEDVDNFVEDRFDLMATNRIVLIVSIFIFITSMSHKD